MALLIPERDFYRSTLDGSALEATALVVGAALTLLFAVDAEISGFVFMSFGDEL